MFRAIVYGRTSDCQSEGCRFESCFLHENLFLNFYFIRQRNFIIFFVSFMKSTSGRRVFQSAVKKDSREPLERLEVRMLAQVTAMGLRSPHVERSRFPW